MITIESTPNSPEIIFSESFNLIKITGNSYLSNPIAFYQFLFDWIKGENVDVSKECKVDLKIGYCSSASLQILNLFLNSLSEKFNKNIVLNIFIDEEDKEDGIQIANELCFNTSLNPQIFYYS